MDGEPWVEILLKAPVCSIGDLMISLTAIEFISVQVDLGDSPIKGFYGLLARSAANFLKTLCIALVHGRR